MKTTGIAALVLLALGAGIVSAEAGSNSISITSQPLGMSMDAFNKQLGQTMGMSMDATTSASSTSTASATQTGPADLLSIFGFEDQGLTDGSLAPPTALPGVGTQTFDSTGAGTKVLKDAFGNSIVSVKKGKGQSTDVMQQGVGNSATIIQSN